MSGFGKPQSYWEKNKGTGRYHFLKMKLPQERRVTASEQIDLEIGWYIFRTDVEGWQGSGDNDQVKFGSKSYDRSTISMVHRVDDFVVNATTNFSSSYGTKFKLHGATLMNAKRFSGRVEGPGGTNLGEIVISLAGLSDIHDALPRNMAALKRAAAEKRCTVKPRPKPKSSPGGGPGGCFLTTACCEALSLPDDCFELTALRRFRDGHLKRTPQGREAVRAYYDLAPRLLAALAPMPAREAYLRRLYTLYILPCAVMARLGLSRQVGARYERMMREVASLCAPASQRGGV
ncbi:MAG: CFI-box-CTERM domain-containing protein [Pseudomonadota bacterium]